MPSSNVELVRSICSAWERGDYTGVDWEHPEIEFVIVDGPAPGRWVGAAGITKGWGRFLGAWEGFHTRIGEVRELDSERVVALGRFGGRGKTSGMELGEIAAEIVGVFDVREGRVTRLALYLDREHALADLGLR